MLYTGTCLWCVLFFGSVLSGVTSQACKTTYNLLEWVKDRDLTVSTSSSSEFGATSARLNTAGAWRTDQLQFAWIQAEFDAPMIITAVLTKGREGNGEWVTEYYVSYSTTNCRSSKPLLQLSGNSDDNSLVKRGLHKPVEAKCFRLSPTSWHGKKIALQFELQGCPAIHNSYLLPEVMEANLQASSVSQFENNGPQRARLGTQGDGVKGGAWSPNATTNNPWIQVQFPELKSITGVVTLGSNSKSEWVSTYEMAYSDTDCNSDSFINITDNKVFRGNQDQDSMVRNVLETPVLAKCVRLYPRTWHGNPSLRFDLLGNPARCYISLLPWVDDSAISASSGSKFDIYRARINGENPRIWCPGTSAHRDHWIQVTFPEHMTITTILTQGGGDGTWVSSYKMSYSIDNTCNSDSFTYFGAEAVKVFTGNQDNDTVVENVLDHPVVAKCVRLRPKTWHGHTCLRFDLEGCRAVDASQRNNSKCTETSNLLPGVNDSALTASSVFHPVFAPPRSRLHTHLLIGGHGAWCSRYITVNEWIQVEFPELMTITNIKTQGRSDEEQWVSTFEMSYSRDCKIFAPYVGHKVFTGNRDRDTVVENVLDTIVVAKCVRLRPKTWHGNVCLRFDLEGCRAVDAAKRNNSQCIATSNLLPGVNDSALTASSVFHPVFAPPRARLHTQKEKRAHAAWCSRYTTLNEWIQVEFPEIMTITKIKTQGRGEYEQWVSAFEMSYSTDCNTFAPYVGHKIFDGNEDSTSVVRRVLPYPVVAKCVRLHPKSFSRFQCLLFDLEGCSAECRTSLLPWVDESAIFASSAVEPLVHRARINSEDPSVWCPRKSAQGDHWIQVMFRNTLTITAILTQGGGDSQWVSAYRMSYSTNSTCTPDSFKYYGARAARAYTSRSVVFTGNRDRKTILENVLDTPVVAKCVQLRPKTWHGHACLRFDLEGCRAVSPLQRNNSECTSASNQLPAVSDSAFTASSVYDNSFAAHRARLYSRKIKGGKGAWCSEIVPLNEWIQVKFPELMIITKIKTQGRNDEEHWVTSFEMSYSRDCETFAPYVGHKIFDGNKDTTSVVRNVLPYPVVAKCVRLHPEFVSSWSCLLFDLEGCSADSSHAPWKKQVSEI